MIKIVDCMEALLACVGVKEITGFDSFHINNSKAIFSFIDDKTMSQTYRSLSHWKNTTFGDYKSALACVSKFVMCFTVWFQKWLKNEIVIMFKVVLSRYMIQKYKDELLKYPLTHLFIILIILHNNHRKLSVNIMSEFLSIIKKHEPSGMKYIAYMIPTKEIFELTSDDNVIEIHDSWLKWMPLLELAIKNDWKCGVRKSSIQRSWVRNIHEYASEDIKIERNIFDIILDRNCNIGVYKCGIMYLHVIDSRIINMHVMNDKSNNESNNKSNDNSQNRAITLISPIKRYDPLWSLNRLRTLSNFRLYNWFMSLIKSFKN
jgi:hypothetical protein